MADPRVIRVFVASPDDVSDERRRLDWVVQRLNSEFAEAAVFRTYRWEQNFYQAHKTFQSQITDPAECDVVIVVFGARLGSQLPDDFQYKLPDGTAYPSGTAYELLHAIDAAERTGHPEIYVFRKTERPMIAAGQREAFDAADRELQRLDGFFQTWFRTPAGGFRRAFHEFTDTDAFDEAAERLLRQWAEQHLRITPEWQLARDGELFRGLQPFDAKHSRMFFGRTRKVRRAIDELLHAAARDQGRPFLLIVGPSGSGKSSLVRAGLVPRLTAPGVVRNVDRWRVAVMRPGGAANAFMSLATSLYVTGTEQIDDPGGFGPALPELIKGPYKSPAQLTDVIVSARETAAAPIVAALDAIGEAERARDGYRREVRTDLLLIVDQLEEIFASNVTDTQREDFARLLTVLAGSGRIWIVATLRADLYVRILDPHLPFLALKDTGAQYDLASPGEAELTEILQRSAEAAGLTYERDPSGETLDEVLLRDAKGTDTLPLVQFSLKQLYDRRETTGEGDHREVLLTFAAYNALGGLDGAVNQVAEDALAHPDGGLSATETDDALPRLLRRFAVPVGDDPGAAEAHAALTVRSVPLAEATPDELSRRLVEVLVHARLLVSDAPSHGGALLRLAHERILTSWKRARAIIEAHRDFFRIRKDVEIEWSRWLNSGKRRDLLLRATPLAEAQTVARTYGGELRGELRQFIRSSGRWARWRQSRAAAIAIGVAVVSTSFALVALNAERRAASNFEAARDAADSEVSSIALQLRNQKEIRSEVLDTIFSVVQEMLNRIQATADKPEDFAMRNLEAGFDKLEALTTGRPGASHEIEALRRSQATMLYQFAETYHQTAKDPAKALDLATKSLALWEQLMRAADPPPETRVGYALTHMLLGDLTRQAIEAAKTRTAGPVNLDLPRQHLEEARRTFQSLVNTFNNHTDWALNYSQLLTKLGDLEKMSGNLAAEEQRYQEAQLNTLAVFQNNQLTRPTVYDGKRDFAYGDEVHEVAWTYRKIGDAQTARQRFTDATASYRDEVCVRHYLIALDASNRLWAQDLGFALTKLGDTLSRPETADAPAARMAYFEAMQVRLELAELQGSEPFDRSNFAVALIKVAGVIRVDGDTDTAALFELTAGDIRKQAQSRPAGQAPSASSVWDGVTGEEQAVVHRYDDEFIRPKLKDIGESPETCWNDLVKSITSSTRAADARE